jgi:hypothetical protein
MMPGTYVFEGVPNFNKVSAVNLSAPTTGSYAGVSYYQAADNSNDISFNGSSTNVGGLIYAPTEALNYNGSLGQYTVVVAGYGNLNASTGLDSGTPVGQSLIKGVVLVQ